MTSSFSVGQRWISDTELELGLGMVADFDNRRVQILFPVSQQQRIYASHDAPLTRVRFRSGDQIESVTGEKLEVITVHEDEGLLTYECRDIDNRIIELPETRLAHHVEFNDPLTRLSNGQYDKEKWFSLRYQALSQTETLFQSDVYGLCGARIDLVPHQLYIAKSVTTRHAPRILLADEVGLGKTIEACLILHQMLINNTAERALIVVPESLLHQWLVELLRRFNLKFSIFDSERMQDIHSQENNPFLNEQLVLCSLEFLTSQAIYSKLAKQAEWDILIVDEAHHLFWSPEHSSPEYDAIEQLAGITPSVLLLTATPEQLGKAGHFARLRLLDPERFYDLDAFVKEESSYQDVADAVNELLTQGRLSKQSADMISNVLQDVVFDDHLQVLQHADDEALIDKARNTCLSALIDRHGTGRVLFRNTRSAIGGFPQRQCLAAPCELPAQYHFSSEEHGTDTINASLCPEVVYKQLQTDRTGRNWCEFDSRVAWLTGFLKDNTDVKVLIICHHTQTAIELQAWLRHKYALACSVFHESMTIIERDRAAAFFADMEEGAQALICSEIGSEGRNFQFAHHLVMFDLPLNPDLLEQRIGRLDRIGQKQTITIHVPYFTEHPQQGLFEWYHAGLNAFEKNCPVAQNIYVECEEALHDIISHQTLHADKATELVSNARVLYDNFNQTLQKNRDRLLEYNSCRPDLSHQIQYEIQQTDQDKHLYEFIQNLFDMYGINFDFHSAETFVASPSDHMLLTHFPHIPDEGMTLTFSRPQALSHENHHFFTWEHPLVRDALDLIMTGEHGRTALSVYKIKNVPAGQVFIETLFAFECSAPKKLQIHRYIDTTFYRIVIDKEGNDAGHRIQHGEIDGEYININKQTGLKVIRTLLPTAERILAVAQKQADIFLLEQINKSKQAMYEELQSELERLQYLQSVNPNVRDSEINYIRELTDTLAGYLDGARLRLDAMHVIVTA